jgi:hypothetical protein
VATKKENDLQQRVSTGKRRYLVFTSAGDRTNLRMWLAEDRRFDLWITYYGDDPDTLEAMATIGYAGRAQSFRTYGLPINGGRTSSCDTRRCWSSMTMS